MNTPETQETPTGWRAALTEKTRTLVAFSEHYVANFPNAGIPGQLTFQALAEVARVMDAALEGKVVEFVAPPPTAASMTNLLTERQAKAIYAIGSSAGLSAWEVDGLTKSQFGCPTEALTRYQASQFIDYLKGQQAPATPGAETDDLPFFGEEGGS